MVRFPYVLLSEDLSVEEQTFIFTRTEVPDSGANVIYTRYRITFKALVQKCVIAVSFGINLIKDFIILLEKRSFNMFRSILGSSMRHCVL